MKKLDERILLTKTTLPDLSWKSNLQISREILENQLAILEALKELEKKSHNDEIFGPL